MVFEQYHYIALPTEIGFMQQDKINTYMSLTGKCTMNNFLSNSDLMSMISLFITEHVTLSKWIAIFFRYLQHVLDMSFSYTVKATVQFSLKADET